MKDPEELRILLQQKLIGSTFVDVPRIDYNADTVGDVMQLQLYLRCTESLTSRMQQVVAPQFPSALVLNAIEIWAAIGDLATEGEIDLMASETLTMAAVGIDSMPYYGINLDPVNSMVTTPVLSRTNFANTHPQLRNKKKAHAADRWALALAAGISVRQLAAGTLNLQILHVPDRSADTITSEELETAMRLSMGWNYYQNFIDSKSFFAHESPRLSEKLRNARALAST